MRTKVQPAASWRSSSRRPSPSPAWRSGEASCRRARGRWGSSGPSCRRCAEVWKSIPSPHNRRKPCGRCGFNLVWKPASSLALIHCQFFEENTRVPKSNEIEMEKFKPITNQSSNWLTNTLKSLRNFPNISKLAGFGGWKRDKKKETGRNHQEICLHLVKIAESFLSSIQTFELNFL